jgi:microcin C transport system substrate-binding protein
MDLISARYVRFGLVAVALALVLPMVGPSAWAQDAKRTGLSLIGEPKYPADFKHFAWVNPDAPKGGKTRMFAEGSFDSLNPWPIQGQPAGGMGLVFESLFATSPDEASTEYANIAAWASFPSDYSSATFEIRAAAKFHDGRPITPEDVIFSLESLKKASPRMSAYYKDVASAEKTGERQVTFRFSEKNNRELPHIVTSLQILPKHWWEAKGANGEPRDIMKSSLEVPLGSGPYRVKSFEPGRQITYERVQDWWAKDLPVMRGQYNFDEIQYVYFRDRTPGFESFKAGSLDYWTETSAKSWATEFEFEALKKGLVQKLMPARKRVTPMQGFYMNLRKPMFQDVRVRRAFNLAFDFEWANKNLFYDSYTRTNSFFANSELAAVGLPAGRELEILNEVKAGVPAEVFTTEYKNPFNATPEDARRSLGLAAKLLAEAGYTLKNGVMTNAAGTQLVVEILLDNPIWDRIVQPYKGTLERLGIKTTVRIIDTAQYKRRTDKFEFDLVVDVIAQSESPGNEQRDFWGTTAAKTEGSRNTLGIQNPAVDALVEKIVFAKDRADLIAATRALDRVLLWNHYVVPHWNFAADRIAMWDQFSGPSVKPERDFAFVQTWWYDAAKAAKLKAARGN